METGGIEVLSTEVQNLLEAEKVTRGVVLAIQHFYVYWSHFPP